MQVVEGTATVADVDEFVERLGAIGDEYGVAVQAFDARYVVDRAHLERAVELADRAFERGEGIARDRAVEILLKGKEIKLPEDHSFRDKDGVARQRIRIRWWEPGPHTYRSLFMGPTSAEAHIPDRPVSTDYELDYGAEEPPVFLGHYWLDGKPAPLADNVACLDYSVARPGGKLVAYRWDGEQQLDAGKFVAVERRK